MPLHDTIEDFWRMIWENFCEVVVSLLTDEECSKVAISYLDFVLVFICRKCILNIFYEISKMRNIMTDGHPVLSTLTFSVQLSPIFDPCP